MSIEGFSGPGRPLLVSRTACPACSSPDWSRLVDLPFQTGPLARYLRDFYRGRLDPDRLSHSRYQLDRCRSCGLLFQRQVPTDAFLIELYEDLAFGQEDDTSQQRGLAVRRSYAYDVEQLIKYWRGSTDDQLRVLDYGAGFGLWLQMAKAYGCHTTAAEFSTGKMDLARALADDIISVDRLPADTFHFINTEQVIEHLVEPRQALEAMARALVPGGLLRVSVPNGGPIESLLDSPDWTATKGQPRSLNAIAPLEHVNCFTHPSLAGLGARVGLTRFDYPVGQFLESGERVRFLASAIVHSVRRPRGTLLYFRRT